MGAVKIDQLTMYDAFNNGLITGLAMGGITIVSDDISVVDVDIWNDEEIYTYFYIDFKQPMTVFSSGMAIESMIVSDGGSITPIIGVERISSTIYKFYCDLEDKPNGVNVANFKNSLLTYANGNRVPEFVNFFYVAGQWATMRLAYAMDNLKFFDIEFSISDNCTIGYWSFYELNISSDRTDLIDITMAANDINMNIDYY